MKKSLKGFVNRWWFLAVASVAVLSACGSNNQSSTHVFRRKFSNVVYAEDGINKNLLDVVLPKEGNGPYPLVVFVHGGGWCSLKRDYGILEPLLTSLRESGYASAYVDYTLNKVSSENGVTYASTVNYPQMLNDVRCAVRHLKANSDTYHIDPNNIFLLGESAGAHLSMMVGTTAKKTTNEDKNMGYANYDSSVKGVLSFYGPSLYDMEDEMNVIFLQHIYGLDYTIEDWQNCSPYYNVDEDMCPLFLTHGRNDATVPFVNSMYMETKAKEKMGEEKVTTYFLDEAAHASPTIYNGEPVINEVKLFLDKWSK